MAPDDNRKLVSRREITYDEPDSQDSDEEDESFDWIKDSE